jgi:hypothetical protein
MASKGRFPEVPRWGGGLVGYQKWGHGDQIHLIIVTGTVISRYIIIIFIHTLPIVYFVAVKCFL